MQFRQIKPKLNSFLLLVTLLCLFLFWSCGDSISPSEYPAFGTGVLFFNFVYHDNTDRHLRSEAAKIDCDGQGIATVEAKVYDSHNNMKIADGGPWNCDNGHGKITSVPAGSDRTVIVLGKDADENIIFRGQTSSIEVIASSENNIGTVECYGFVPNPLAPTEKAAVVQDTVVLQWEEVAGATEYRVLVSQNSDMSDPVIEEYAAIADTAPSGLAPITTYYWQVFAVDIYGNRGIGSQIRSFTVAGRLPDTGQTNDYTDTDGEDSDYTIKELYTLADKGRHYPAVNSDYFSTFFSNGEWTYWSSTTYAGISNNAWLLDFQDGNIWSRDKTNTEFVLAVHGEPSSNTLVDNDDGTVTDLSTGLMWQQYGAVDTDGNLTPLAWNEALAYCEDLKLAGHYDWRLPNINELQSIVDYQCYHPSVNMTFFPDTESETYWSSTTYVPDNAMAWDISFFTGEVMTSSPDKSKNYYVRAVRDGQ